MICPDCGLTCQFQNDLVSCKECVVHVHNKDACVNKDAKRLLVNNLGDRK